MSTTKITLKDATSDALTHFAVARAAHIAGDRDLEREARRLLEDEHGIRVTFTRRFPGEAAR